jgi:hypothetical protein
VSGCAWLYPFCPPVLAAGLSFLLLPDALLFLLFSSLLGLHAYVLAAGRGFGLGSSLVKGGYCLESLAHSFPFYSASLLIPSLFQDFVPVGLDCAFGSGCPLSFFSASVCSLRDSPFFLVLFSTVGRWTLRQGKALFGCWSNRPFLSSTNPRFERERRARQDKKKKKKKLLFNHFQTQVVIIIRIYNNDSIPRTRRLEAAKGSRLGGRGGCRVSRAIFSVSN